MKKILVPLVLVAVLGACKKDGSPAKKMYLSKVFENNLLSVEYLYSSDMKPIRRNWYNTSQGQSVYGGFKLYEYTNGQMTKVLSYNKNDQLSSREGISYNASKQISRIDFYGNDDVIDNYFLYVYENGRLTEINGYSAAPVKKTNETFFKHDPKGNVISIRRYYLLSSNWILNDSMTIAPGKELPSHWQYYEMDPFEFPFERTFLHMHAESMYYYVAGAPPIKSDHTYTQKLYNGAGCLTAQHYKIVVDNAVTISTIDTDLKYEYIE